MLFGDFLPEDKNEVSIYFQGQLIKFHLVKLESLDHTFHLLFFMAVASSDSSLNTYVLIWKVK